MITPFFQLSLVTFPIKFDISVLLCSVKKMMSEDVGMQIEKPATLPWYPPFCKAFKGRIKRYDKFPSLGNWQMIGVKHPEKSIEEAYTQHSPEQNLQEWGARVSQAMKKVNFIKLYDSIIYDERKKIKKYSSTLSDFLNF